MAGTDAGFERRKAGGMIAMLRDWWMRMPWNYSPSRHLVEVANRALAAAARTIEKDAV
jgi:hypothetical protein